MQLLTKYSFLIMSNSARYIKITSNMSEMGIFKMDTKMVHNVWRIDSLDKSVVKNRFSHIHDALQYLLLGAGEGRSLVLGGKTSKPFVAKRAFDVYTVKPKRNIHDRRNR